MTASGEINWPPMGRISRPLSIIHTGKGTSYTTSASTHLYQGRGWYVWNNTGDKVILRRADGSLKDTCSYSGAGGIKYCLSRSRQ